MNFWLKIKKVRTKNRIKSEQNTNKLENQNKNNKILQTVHLDLLDDFDPFQTEYASLAREIAYLNLIEANEQERLAIFINIYNIMLIHISYKYGLPGTIWQRRKYLYFTYYNIGGHLYSLQSIFNGILRGNHTGLGMLWKPFGEQDYRNKVKNTN
ncbi:unnamed protein product [Meloidogyne enterolobii]|uniref:Uncharacterized protein n=1 Tax=Meloidogyne enterolobii TaxID=390850 RepID=A0ACB1AXY3_MELEN